MFATGHALHRIRGEGRLTPTNDYPALAAISDEQPFDSWTVPLIDGLEIVNRDRGGGGDIVLGLEITQAPSEVPSNGIGESEVVVGSEQHKGQGRVRGDVQDSALEVLTLITHVILQHLTCCLINNAVDGELVGCG